ncbi:MAG: hypothetical protein ACOCRK_02035 [bacterium]
MEYNSTEKTIVKDYTLNINKFNKQNILKGKFAKINMFLNLLLMKKNTIQHNPDAGFDLFSYIHMLDRDQDISEMEEELKRQCNIYLPYGISEITMTKVENDAIKIEALTEDNYNFAIETKKDNIFDISIEIPKKDFNG